MTDTEAMARMARTIDAHSERLRKLEIMEAEARSTQKQMDDSLKSIKSDIQWLIRLVIGALLLALIAYIVGGGFAVP